MNRPSHIEISEFYASRAQPLPRQAKTQRFSKRNWSRVLGLAGTITLHGLAVQALVPGASHNKPRPEVLEAGVVLQPIRVAAPAEELVLVTVDSGQKNTLDLSDQITFLSQDVDKLEMPAVNPDTLPVFEVVDADSELSTEQSAHGEGDPAERALMFGRYTGQINSRVERAWIRPRSAIEDDPANQNHGVEGSIFRCHVQIRQDLNGNVQEVLLLQCNGTEAWRHSLVVAIDQSSPLPAPPTPTVFTKVLTMTFTANEYKKGGVSADSDLFEPEAVSHSAKISTAPGLSHRGVGVGSEATEELMP